MPKTKIVATLGPASDAESVLERLLLEGVNVFRLNASHGTQADHGARIEKVRAISARLGKFAAILLDLQGPKIRLEKFENGGCELVAGAEFTITVDSVLGSCSRASTSYENFADDVKPGDRVLLADGAIELEALSNDGRAVTTRVIRGGPISNNKGINLPGVQVSSPSLTPKDLADLEFALQAGVDIIALSFVRTAEDVRDLRARIGDRKTLIVSKIEKPQAYDNIESILDHSDGVMVARGDLGVEVELEKVPRIQKSIIRRARRKGKFVITATQMLESMIERPTPTRAEVSDVANAIYDGTDAVMLSAESSTGKYPVETVRMMARIAKETELAMVRAGFQEPPRAAAPTTAEVVADAAYHAARDVGAAAIVVFTSSGSSARLISRYRPPVSVYAVTPNEYAARALAVSWGVEAMIAPEVDSTDQMLGQVDRLVMEKAQLQKGQRVVFVAGQPVGRPGTTNLMKVHRIGDS